MTDSLEFESCVMSSSLDRLTNEDYKSIPFSLLNIQRMSQITFSQSDFVNEATKFVEKYPWIDFIYEFKLPEKDNLFDGHDCFDSLPKDTGKGVYIAGSTALHKMEYFLRNKISAWKATDTDLFILGCNRSARLNESPSGTDIVFSKEENIDELLINFDFSCCRVAFDFKYTYYCSLQAIVAIYHNKVFFPKYMTSDVDFINKLKKYENNVTFDVENVCIKLVDRFRARVKKYSQRGYESVFTHMDYLLPWVVNRFSYVDFKDDVSTDISEISKEEKIEQEIALLQKKLAILKTKTSKKIYNTCNMCKSLCMKEVINCSLCNINKSIQIEASKQEAEVQIETKQKEGKTMFRNFSAKCPKCKNNRNSRITGKCKNCRIITTRSGICLRCEDLLCNKCFDIEWK